MLSSPALRLLHSRHSPRLVLVASAHQKSKSNFLNKEVKSKKYKGRLEYLNRGDPFEKADRTKEEVQEKESVRKHLPNTTRAYLWGNGELGALGQPGFLHPRIEKKEVLKIMRRPFISSLGNYFKLKTAAFWYGFTLFATKDY